MENVKKTYNVKHNICVLSTEVERVTYYTWIKLAGIAHRDFATLKPSQMDTEQIGKSIKILFEPTSTPNETYDICDK